MPVVLFLGAKVSPSENLISNKRIIFFETLGTIASYNELFEFDPLAYIYIYIYIYIYTCTYRPTYINLNSCSFSTSGSHSFINLRKFSNAYEILFRKYTIRKVSTLRLKELK